MDGSLADYIEWRGDLTFEQDGFNTVDNFIFCQLAYANLGATYKQGIRLRECAESLLNGSSDDFNLLVATVEDRELLRIIAASRRFGNLVISNCSEVFDGDAATQFAAFTFELSKDFCFVAVRGTDCTLAGWKENFMVSFTEVGAQKLMLKYLENEILKYSTVYLGGHSKGSNLAMYAAAMLSDKLQSKLKKVYLNDGPGLCGEVVDLSRIKRIAGKCVKICPEYSIIGRLFEYSGLEEEIIVRSSASGPFQHALVTWRVRGRGVVAAKGYDKTAMSIGKAVANWIGNMTKEGREAFVNSLFTIASERKNAKFSELQGLDSLERVLLRLIKSDSKTRRSLLGKNGNKKREKKAQPSFAALGAMLARGGMYHGAMLALIGVFCCAFPSAAPIVAAAIAALALFEYQVYLTAKTLNRAGWRLGERRLRLFSLAVSSVIYFVLMFRSDGLIDFSGIIWGTTLLVYGAITAYRSGRHNSFGVLTAVECAVCIVCGLAFLLCSWPDITVLTTALGLFLIFDGFVTTLLAGYKILIKNNIVLN